MSPEADRDADDLPRIDSDAPTEQDDLGREPYVRALDRIVQTAETPLVVAIYGAWGAGKTSLMMQLRRRLDPNHDGSTTGEQYARTVWFDPWMHQFDDSPALALLHAATDQLNLGVVARRNVVAALSKLAIALGEDIQLPFLGIRVGKLFKIREALAQDDFNRREERARLRQHFHEVLAAAGVAEKRLVFFIDDLDRCQPAVALALLEALKLYLDMPGCVYVLGVDREPLEAAVGAQYATLGLRAESYLDKIIQLPFAIPAISDTAMNSFVAKRLSGELASCAQILAAATADEPRNVKRLANSLLINHELAKEATFETGYDPRILTMVVLIQNKAPSLYRQLRLDPALITDLFDSRGSEPPDPLSVEKDKKEVGLWDLYVRENPRLERALNLIELPNDVDLTPYITLTSIAPVVDSSSSVGAEVGRVYISYQRSDAFEWASRISDSLTQLGWEVFRDVGLSPGQDFVEVTRESLATSDAVLILMGPAWLERTLKDPDDLIRFELEQAAELDLLVIPILVDGAEMPQSDELPESLRFLSNRNALFLEELSYSRSIAELDRALRLRLRT